MARVLKISLAILALAAVAWAGDVWKEKPYQQWTEKDVSKIMAESPWTKQTLVEVTWRSGAETPEGGPTKSIPSRSGHIGGSQTTYGTPDAATNRSSASFFASWASSRVVREARARQQILKGKMTQEEADKQLAQEPQEYSIIMFGQDMMLFDKADEDSLKQQAYLELKSSSQRIAPAHVNIFRTEDRISVGFSFPKKSPNGEVTIPANEKSVEFVSRVGKTEFKFRFDLQKMVDNQGRDL